jgi:hypothetical protein
MTNRATAICTVVGVTHVHGTNYSHRRLSRLGFITQHEDSSGWYYAYSSAGGDCWGMVWRDGRTDLGLTGIGGRLLGAYRHLADAVTAVRRRRNHPGESFCTGDGNTYTRY